jgi:NADPH:quinone reductase-like Zn-dependent oxidoreductase
MKAILYHEYGSPYVLKLENIEKPIPKDNEVLVKVKAIALNAKDWRLMRADPFLVRLTGTGLFKPKNPILGADIAGIIESVGKDVKSFKIGDEVFGDICETGHGGLAEYTCSTEEALAHKPSNATFEEAAALPLAAVSALQGLRDVGEIQSGQQVLINGASGGMGAFAVQIAKAFGAEVTAVCSTRNIDLVRSLGADHVIDYTKENFTRNGKSYDLILAVNGFHPISDYKKSLSPNGKYVMGGGSTKQIFQALLLGSFVSMGSNKKIAALSGKANQADLVTIKELVEAGKLKSVIDSTFDLEDTADAIRYMEEGHAKGKIIIKIEN